MLVYSTNPKQMPTYKCYKCGHNNLIPLVETDYLNCVECGITLFNERTRNDSQTNQGNFRDLF